MQTTTTTNSKTIKIYTQAEAQILLQKWARTEPHRCKKIEQDRFSCGTERYQLIPGRYEIYLPEYVPHALTWLDLAAIQAAIQRACKERGWSLVASIAPDAASGAFIMEKCMTIATAQADEPAIAALAAYLQVCDQPAKNCAKCQHWKGANWAATAVCGLNPDLLVTRLDTCDQWQSDDEQKQELTAAVMVADGEAGGLEP